MWLKSSFVQSASIKGEGLKSFTAASHQGAIKVCCLFLFENLIKFDFRCHKQGNSSSVSELWKECGRNLIPKEAPDGPGGCPKICLFSSFQQKISEGSNFYSPKFKTDLNSF